jgi:DNA-binding HxlR family transcriptional regulator
MERTSFAQMRCSLARGLDLIGDWWSPLILRDLFLGVVRFDELVEDLGISRNLLTRRLRALATNGIVDRVAYQRRPMRYEYRLTAAGRDLVPVLLALTAWGDRWAAPRQGRPIVFRHARCNHECIASVTCSACGEPLTVNELVALPGPGGAATRGTKVVARKLVAAARKPVIYRQATS